MSARKFVALDLETTSLDVHLAHPLEVAAVEIDPAAFTGYGETMSFVPHTDRPILNAAEPESLAVNRWYERRLFDAMLTAPQTADRIDALVELLTGATIVGANPAYDAAVLWRWLRDRTDLDTPPWHFRLYDVEVATAAALGLTSIPSLTTCAEALDVPVDAAVAHTALGDAFLTAEVFTAVYGLHRAGDVDAGEFATEASASDGDVDACTCMTAAHHRCAVHGGVL